VFPPGLRPRARALLFAPFMPDAVLFDHQAFFWQCPSSGLLSFQPVRFRLAIAYRRLSLRVGGNVPRCDQRSEVHERVAQITPGSHRFARGLRHIIEPSCVRPDVPHFFFRFCLQRLAAESATRSWAIRAPGRATQPEAILPDRRLREQAATTLGRHRHRDLARVIPVAHSRALRRAAAPDRRPGRPARAARLALVERRARAEPPERPERRARVAHREAVAHRAARGAEVPQTRARQAVPVPASMAMPTCSARRTVPRATPPRSARPTG
jgi:hypothetical protein